MSVDSRIVTMKFDNAQFQKGAATTMSTLDKLKQSLNFGSVASGATKGLGFISSALAKFGIKNPFARAEQGVADLGKTAQQAAGPGGVGAIEGGVTGVSKTFLAMSTIAITALSNITNRAMQAGTQLAKSLTIDPIKMGLDEYELGLNSVQTILANTKASGATLKDVNATLLELNHYADKTIYNFGEMARNIGTFTAAGVDLDTATGSIKGIANLAALSGSSAAQASSAMYQLSQEIAAGRVTLMGWNSVVNAGMGGATFQRALAQTAVAMGTIDKGALKLTGKMKNVTINGEAFRDSISAASGKKSWLTSDVLTSTLKQFSGDLKEADLAAQGFTKSQIKAIMSQAKTATDAATKVKTLTQLIDVAKESAQSGWAQTWQTIFGNFGQAKKTFTEASDTINGFIERSSKARNDLLKGWSKLGGRTTMIEGIKNAFNAVVAVLGTVKEAFRDIFPPMTAQELMNLTQGFADFTASLKPNRGTLENLRRTLAGVFAIFSIVWSVVKGVVGVIGDLIGVVSKGSGSFLNFTGGIGDFLVSLDEAIKKGGLLEGFFNGLSGILQVPIRLFQALAGFIGDIFSGFDSGAADGVTQSLSPMSALAERVSSAFEGLSKMFGRVGEALAPLGEMIGAALRNVTDALAMAFSGENFDATLDLINTGLFAGLVLLIKRFVKNGLSIDFGGGMFESITEAFGGLTDTLGAMQANLQASTLMKIAAAVGILTLSIVALSLIDSDKLTKAMTAISVGFGILLGAMSILTKISGSAGFIKVPMIAASMVLLASSMLILSAAVKILSTMSWEELAKGLGATAALLLMLSLAVKPLSANAGGMIRAAAALTILGVALNVMAVAMKIMASMSWEEMGKGLAGVAGSLVILAGAMRLMPKGMLMQAAAILILSTALSAMGAALKIFASMSWEEMAKGLITLAGALVIIAGAMHIMPQNMLLQAAALVAVGVALNLIGTAVSNMGGMTWEDIAKGMVTLAGALLILAGGLYLMTGALPGAAALVVAAAALAILTPVLIALGAMSWESIAKGLLALAGAFTVLGLAGLVLAPLSPIILALGVAIALIGAGFALAGAGALAFAAAFGIVVAAGAAGVKILGSAISTLVKAIPGAFKALAKGLVQFAKVIANNGPAFVRAISTIISSILKAIIKNIPLIGKAFMTLIDTALRVLVSAVPKMVTAGMQILLGVLRGIRNHISQIIKVGTDIIVKFINGVGNAIPRVIQAGVRLVLKFINGVANAIRSNQSQLISAGKNLAGAIVDGMVAGIGSGIGAVKDAAMNLAKSALDSAKGFLGIKSPSREFKKIGKWTAEGFKEGLIGGLDDVKEAMSEMNATLKEEMEKQRASIQEEQEKLDELLDAKKRDDKAIAQAKKRLAAAEAMYASAKSAREAFMKDLKKEKTELRGLAKEYDQVSKKIEEAKSALEDAIKTRNDAEKSIADSYTRRPDIDEESTVASYTEALQTEAEKNKVFLDSLNELVALGMDDATYQKFLDEGVGIQPFLDQLIAAGPDAVEAIDENTASLEKSAKKLGKKASRELYQAGVDSARGILNGLRSQRSKIEKEMREIANLISRTVRKELKIKSPSRVFMEIGRYTNEGLAEGLVKYSGSVEKSASGVGNAALEAMRASMAGVSDAISNELDSNPVIAPVLDLTQLKKDASGISSAMGSKAMAAQVSYGQAASISNTREAIGSDSSSVTSEPAAPIQFIQNNNSPKALSHVEIYRSTRNQLSLAKEALTNS